MASNRDPEQTEPINVNKENEGSSTRVPTKAPSLPATIGTTSRAPEIKVEDPESKCASGTKKCFKFLYNRENKTYCNRTCNSWLKIIIYSIMYIIFLSTYTMVFLYGSLAAIKSTNFVEITDVRNPVIGLTATPISETNDGNPLIWYRSGEENDYQKYVRSLDNLLLSRKENFELIRSLGPCGQPPYGYGDKPCVIIRINKKKGWAGKPLTPNSTLTPMAPKEVQTWVQSGQMLWLHCIGANPYDEEHLGNITYYPHPPGLDPKLYPLDMKAESPLLAVQFSGYTRGISVAVICRLWYEQGPSSVHFALYIAP